MTILGSFQIAQIVPLSSGCGMSVRWHTSSRKRGRMWATAKLITPSHGKHQVVGCREIIACKQGIIRCAFGADAASAISVPRAAGVG